MVYYGKPYHPQYGNLFWKRNRDRSFFARLILGARPNDKVCTVHFFYDGTLDDDDIESLVPHFIALGTIRELQLEDTAISSDGMSQLRKLRNLEVLNICNTDLDDAAVSALQSLESLHYLDIFGTGLSVEETAEIQSALPNFLIRGPRKGVGYFAHSHYTDA